MLLAESQLLKASLSLLCCFCCKSLLLPHVLLVKARICHFRCFCRAHLLLRESQLAKTCLSFIGVSTASLCCRATLICWRRTCEDCDARLALSRTRRLALSSALSEASRSLRRALSCCSRRSWPWALSKARWALTLSGAERLTMVSPRRQECGRPLNLTK